MAAKAQEPHQGVPPSFEFEDPTEHEDFNLRPAPDRVGTIPEDQRQVSQEAYEARNVLKLLHAKKMFYRAAPDAGRCESEHAGASEKPGCNAAGASADKCDAQCCSANTDYHEFIERVYQAASVGCVENPTEPLLASKALEQIRKDIVRRVGRPLVHRYLGALAAWGFLGIYLGMMLAEAGKTSYPELKGFGWIIVGSMIGAWLSVALTRRQVSFDDLQDYVDFGLEPFVRMLFVGLFAFVLALLFKFKVFDFTIGKLNLSDLITDTLSALTFGALAGLGEKAWSVKLIERAQEVLSGGVSKAR